MAHDPRLSGLSRRGIELNMASLHCEQFDLRPRLLLRLERQPIEPGEESSRDLLEEFSMEADAELQLDVLDELNWEPSVDAAEIDVTVDSVW